jgi:transposase, IS5 family
MARRWAGHRTRKSVHGYKVQVATNEQGGLIRGVEVSTANVHDAAELGAVLASKPGDMYGDSAFAAKHGSAPVPVRACYAIAHSVALHSASRLSAML